MTKTQEHNDPTSITLGEEDSAVVFRADGGAEIFVPHRNNDDDEIAPSSVNVLRCAVMINNDELLDAVDKQIDRMTKT